MSTDQIPNSQPTITTASPGRRFHFHYHIHCHSHATFPFTIPCFPMAAADRDNDSHPRTTFLVSHPTRPSPAHPAVPSMLHSPARPAEQTDRQTPPDKRHLPTYPLPPLFPALPVKTPQSLHVHVHVHFCTDVTLREAMTRPMWSGA